MFKVTHLSGFGGGSQAPTFTSGPSTSVLENNRLSFAITTNAPTTLAISGDDAAKVELVSNTLGNSHTLRWASDGTKDFETPDDLNTDGVYDIVLVATDVTMHDSRPLSFSITVTDVTVEDPNWKTNTKFLVGFEGANGSTVVTDESYQQHGDATASTGFVTTAVSKFGASSYQFSGANSLRWANHADFRLGSNHFTIESFFRLTALGQTQQLIGIWPSFSGFSWVMFVNTSPGLSPPGGQPPRQAPRQAPSLGRPDLSGSWCRSRPAGRPT